jgi:putative transposase
LVADFTYVRLAGGGFAYTAFVIDAFAGRIVGWECSRSKHTAFVERAIAQAAALRARQGNPLNTPQNKAIHHSDAGSQGGFNWSSQHLDDGGVWWRVRGSLGRSDLRVRGGSGLRIGRCGRRCGRQVGRSRRGLCSGTSGG